MLSLRFGYLLTWMLAAVQLALFICGGASELSVNRTHCGSEDQPNIICRIDMASQILDPGQTSDDTCKNTPEDLVIPTRLQSDVKAPTPTIQQLPSGDVLVTIKPRVEASDRNDVVGYTIKFTEDQYSTPGHFDYFPNAKRVCRYLMVNMTHATTQEIEQAQFSIVLDQDTFDVDQSYEVQVQRHPGIRKSSVVFYNHKKPGEDTFWQTFWRKAAPRSEVGMSTIVLSMLNPWNISDFYGEATKFRLCLSDPDGGYILDVFGNIVNCVNLTEENVSSYGNGDIISLHFIDLIPGAYLIKIIRYWGNSKVKALPLASPIVQGWSHEGMLWSDYMSLSHIKSKNQLQITVSVPPHYYLLQSNYLIQIEDSSGTIVHTSLRPVEADELEWSNTTFSLRENLDPGNYNISVQPSGLDGLCPLSTDRAGETVRPCSYNGTCAPCLSWRTSFSIQPLNVADGKGYSMVTPNSMELSIIIVTILTVLIVAVAVLIFLLRKRLRCLTVTSRDSTADKNVYMFQGSEFDESDSPLQMCDDSKDLGSLLTGYTFGTEFGVTSSVNHRVWLAHVGAAAADCLPGTETPNRGNTRAIGDLLQTIMKKHMGIEVVRYDGNASFRCVPHFVLVTLTNELNQLYRKHILSEDIYCEAPDDQLLILHLLGSWMLRRTCIPVFLSFEHVTPHPDLIMYCGQDQPIIYNVPSQMPELMAFLGGGPTSERHPGIETYVKSQEAVELDRLISQCRKAADVNLQRAIEYRLREGYGRAISVQTAPCPDVLPPSEEAPSAFRMAHSSPDLPNLYLLQDLVKSRSRSLSHLESNISRDTGRGSSMGSAGTDSTSCESSQQYQCSEVSLTTAPDSQHASLMLTRTGITV